MKFMLIISIGLIIFFTGCTTTRTAAIRPESRPAIKQITPGKIKTGQSPGEIEDPQTILTLEEALRLALLQNPRLGIYGLEIRAREAAALQESLFPNPEIEIETENFGGSGIYSGVDATETTVSLGQLIELAGKRQKRTQLATFESDLAAWDYEALKLDVYATVVMNYTHVLALQEKIKLNKELLNIAKQLLETIDKRVQAGGLSPAESSRGSVVVSNAEIALQHTEGQLIAARHQLASTWNGKGLFMEAEGTLETNLKIPTKESLIQGLDQTPELARWTTEMDKRHTSLELSKALAVPDPTISLAYRRINESEDNAFVAGLSIPLPFFDRNQGAKQEAQIRVKQGEREKELIRKNLNTRIESIYPTTEALIAEITALQKKSIPEAEKAYSIINDGYQRGKFQLIDVLDAQRTLFEVRGRLVESMTDYQMTITELERLVGQDLQKL